MVKACAKSGEKVFNAYILSSIRFELLVGVIVGSARLFSLFSSVVNRNEWAIAASRYACTIGTKKKGVKFFFNFFFRWVWGVGCGVLGCGCVGVGAWVWVRGAAGCGWAGTGLGRLDRDWRVWMCANRLPGFPNLSVGIAARV